MNLVLFDEEVDWKNLLPFTFTRPISEIRFGIFTIREKWEQAFASPCGYFTHNYLQKKYPLLFTGEALFINGKYCPDEALLKAVRALKSKQALYQGTHCIAFVGQTSNLNQLVSFERINYPHELLCINELWDIFQKLGTAIESDFNLINSQRKSKPLSASVTVIGDRALVFLEEGAKAEACILNTSGGSIYLGKDSEVMEGSVVRGPFVLGEHSALKLSTKIYGPTCIGPHSKVGGEVNNSVIFGYSNKAHDGFLGNSVIGEWCNLGADTNNSNLKNNYGNIKLYNYNYEGMRDTGLQFCGLMMGDHSRSGINTMFNTGTVVGVGCNIYGGGFPPTHIPNFSWGGSEGFVPYQLEKLVETAERVFARRGLSFDAKEMEILNAVSHLKM